MPGASPFPLNLPVNNILAANSTSSTHASSRSILPSSSQKVDEVRRRIHQTHLSYLSVEDSPEKLNLKEKLECLIFELLSIVPHSHKFSSIDVANCFNRSIVEKPDSYSPCDVALSFERLEKYASNLLRHPWRKEYLIMHTYSGYYRHYIDNNLIGASQVLFAMGYREVVNSPGHLVLDGPIDPDKLTKVSLNCMIAMAEAQMIQMMGESLANKGYDNVSYDEIFSIRVRFTAGLDHCIKLICDPSISKSSSCITDSPVSCTTATNASTSGRGNHIEFNNHSVLSSKSNAATCLPLPSYEPMSDHQRNVWHEQMSPVNESTLRTNRSNDADDAINQSNASSISPGANYIPPPALFANVTSNNNQMSNLLNNISPLNSTACINGYNGCQVAGKSSKNRIVNSNSSRIGADTAGADVVDSIMSSLVNRQLNVKSNGPSAVAITTKNQHRIIPRSESDSSELRAIYRADHSSFSNSHHSPSPPYSHPSKSYNHPLYPSASDPNQQQIHQPRIQYPSTAMSTPYTMSLANNSTVSVNHRKLPARLENASNMSRSQLPSNMTSVDAYTSSTPTSVDYNRYNNYESQVNCAKFSFPPCVESNHLKPQQYSQINSTSSTDPQSIQPLTTLRTTNCANVNTRKPPPPPPPAANQMRQQQQQLQHSLPNQLPWACQSCTYLNQGKSDVCEMCSRSRDKKIDSNSLVSGGKECSQCTLVNSRDVDNCKACGSDLINSPTYI